MLNAMDLSRPHGRVLVVDDSRGEGLRTALAADGHEVERVGDGASAIRAVRARPPDLVVLSTVLPDMDGLDVLRVLKSGPAEDFLPVILMSVHSDLDQRVKGLRVGADDFLARPYAEAEAQARAIAMLRIKRLHDELRATTAQLEARTLTDPLTGLYNRRFLQERLAEECSRVRRYKNPLALLLFDIDEFKHVNDAYGHACGDLVLEGTADTLRSTVRNVDLCCRHGGDEFAVILPETGTAGAQRVAERFLLRLRERVHRLAGVRGAAPVDVRVTASMGIAAFPEVQSADELLRCADRALYVSKRQGRDRVTVYLPAS